MNIQADPARKNPARPVQVRLGVLLLACSYSAGLGRALFAIPWHFLKVNPPWLEFTVILLTVTIPAYYCVMFAIWKGSYQARIIYTVMVALSMGASIQMLVWYSYPAIQNLFTAIVHITQIGGVILLFQPVSNRWFKHHQLAKALLNNSKYGF